MNLREHIRDIPNYPKEGIVFFDITPLLSSPKAFRFAVDQLAEKFGSRGATKIAAAEARGFIFAAPLAYTMGLPFVPMRKPGKLPYRTMSVTYDLEYGTDTLCMHVDAIERDDKVLIIDDLLATGGTVNGMIKIVEQAGASVAGLGFVIELGFLPGGQILREAGFDHTCLLNIT
ncbi:Adenine phosphoribosyltransferase [Alkalidesulfovibrio alkalitolerans DSM 16529]|uniref:Adenine phosphoribosyltransferase n=1 Tax=Alkalidesulfovibrio alkalitolerans DSM 16529 TaxID=1121439 RepID=S7UEV9_9BACT|nr:adenine phosphoribosyltransferase [Alkalidesulfovibrio alkalitolerans]EPR32349.1 Adenine phosphoribosyltransferase [Alkalidesulfovibrio alkalitolerans DSM 16529]